MEHNRLKVVGETQIANKSCWRNTAMLSDRLGSQFLALLVMTACLRQAAAAASERDGRIFTLEQLR